MKAKAVLFDMDGVLIDTYMSWYVHFNHALRHFGRKELTLDEFDYKVWSRDFREIVKEYFPGKTVDEIRNFYFSDTKGMEKVVVIDGAKDAILGLRKMGLKLAIVSNTYNKMVCYLLSKAGLSGYFDAIVGGDDVKMGKPEPDIVLLACSKLGVDVKDAVLVGDSEFDILCGKNAGIKTIGFRIDGDKKVEKLTDIIRLVR